MKTLTLYNSFAPAYRSNGFTADAFEMLDRLFDSSAFEESRGRSPAVDVRETEAGYHLEVELPGLSEKDLRLEVKDGILALSTAKKEEGAAESDKGVLGTWLRRERREFTFARSFLLPENADAEGIEAKLKDGLLSVEIPKKPEAAPRLVPVKVA